MSKNKQSSVGGYYFLANILTVAILAITLVLAGPHALVPVVILAIIEVTFSFDNAVVNSQVLSGMNNLWRNLFLTVGIVVAVFGVRLFVPLLLVSVTTGLTLAGVFDAAIHQPEVYAKLLEQAYPLIAAFGGVFLLLVGVHFFAEPRATLWLKSLEKPLVKLNNPWLLTLLAATVALLSLCFVASDNLIGVEVAGLLGVVIFVSITLASDFMKSRGDINRMSWVLFIYLEILDASFSLDGVIAAFAITKDVLLIAAGLGIGALYVRSMTIHVLNRGVLGQYKYLIHGAHYAIVTLAIILLISIKYHVPNIIAGIASIGFVLVALQGSRRYNQRS